MAAFVSKYSWKPGYSYKVSASTVGNALKKIEEEEGTVSAKGFLEYSRSEDSETHSMFEWRDDVAAEKYRLSQAGQIINQLAIEIVYTDDPTPKNVNVKLEDESKKQIVSAYVNVVPKSTKASASFVNTLSALESEEFKEQVLANALSELRAFRHKYGTLKEVASIVSEIEKLEQLMIQAE